MFKLIGHMVLSVLLLISVTGMTVNMHFCQGHLYDLALNAPAHDCCDPAPDCCEPLQDRRACHHDHDMAGPHHCDDKSIQIESSHEYVITGYSFDFKDPYIFILFSTPTLLIASAETETPFTTRIWSYKKPPPQEVVLAEIQSFLI